MIYVTSDLHFCHDKEWIYQPRGFANVHEMNRAIVDNWNSAVDMDDDVYLLGDVMLNDNAEGLRLLKLLKGRIHIMVGNHDTDTRIEAYKQCWNVVEVEYAKIIKYGGCNFYLSHYPTLTNYLGKRKLAHTIISLCGHVHTNDRFADWGDFPVYHCEVNAHNCTPVSIEQIIEDVKKKW